MKGENADRVEQRYKTFRQKSPGSPAIEKARMRKRQFSPTASVQHYFDAFKENN